MANLSEIIRLGLYETKILIPLSIFPAGTYTQRLAVAGNSLLSSLFVKAIDPATTVKVNYYDYGVGADEGERYELDGHNLISASSNLPDRILVTRVHDKPVIEIIVTGGNARLGIYGTVVASFASDLDSALHLDGETVQLLVDKGMPVMTYDQMANKFFFLRGTNGVIEVAQSEAGDSVHLPGSAVSTPGTAQDLITDSVPTGKVRKLTQAFVSCRQSGSYIVTVDGDTIGSGRTGPGKPDSFFPWTPRYSVAAESEVKITFTALPGTVPSNVEAYLMGSDITL